MAKMGSKDRTFQTPLPPVKDGTIQTPLPPRWDNCPIFAIGFGALLFWSKMTTFFYSVELLFKGGGEWGVWGGWVGVWPEGKPPLYNELRYRRFIMLISELLRYRRGSL